MIFKEMQLAKDYCIGKGIELGAAAHNPFGLPECINVAPFNDEEFFAEHQKKICGQAAKIDIHSDAEHLPFDNDSFDYIISSHVVEHIPDLIGAFLEWNRVIRHDGVVFMIFPKRNALPSDIGRPLSTVDDFVRAHYEPGVREQNIKDALNRHIWVFDVNSMLDLIIFCNSKIFSQGLWWSICEIEQTDSKVGNGHTIVCRIKKQ